MAQRQSVALQVAQGQGQHALRNAVDATLQFGKAQAGIVLVAGDMGDTDALHTAMAGVHGVFSVQPSSGGNGVLDADEVRFGKAVADAAVAAGVQHLVYTSGGGASAETTIPHFATKWQIEQYIRSLPVASTVVRPAAFMEILLVPGFGLGPGQLRFFMQPGQAMQFMAVSDIGQIVARIFADPATFTGRSFDIASDAVTGTQLAAKLGAAAGVPVTYQRFPDEVLRHSELLRMLIAASDEGQLDGQADLPMLRQLYPGLSSFDRWLEQAANRAAIRARLTA